MSREPLSSRSAFTLVELLVVMALLGVLAALLVVATSAVRSSGDRSKATANMRAIGVGIAAYAADHGGTLPGPLWPGQMPEFDPNRSGRLVRELAPYLGIETPSQPEIIDLFVPPAYRKAIDVLSTSRTYVVNMEVMQDDGTVLNPWGSLVGGSESDPLRMSTVPPTAWGFSDADQEHPRVNAASWSANTPPKPIHGKRLAWFFNGSVGSVETAELE